MNAIYTAGDVVLRVGRPTAPASAAIELAELLTSIGVRVPAPAREDAVSDGDLAVTAWERFTLIDAEPDWQVAGEMVARVHALAVDELPPAYPVPHGEEFAWWQFDVLLADVGDLLDPAARRGIEPRSPGTARGRRERSGWSATGTSTPETSWPQPAGRCCSTGTCSVSPRRRGTTRALLTWASRWGGRPHWYADFAAGYGRSMIDDPVAIVTRRAPVGRRHADAAAGRQGRPGGNARSPAPAGVLAG